MGYVGRQEQAQWTADSDPEVPCLGVGFPRSLSPWQVGVVSTAEHIDALLCAGLAEGWEPQGQ